MGWLRSIERWLRRYVLNPAKRSVAGELKARLGDIDAALQKAVLSYAASLGKEPLALFVSVAIAQLGLSDAASKWVQALIDRLGAGSSRSVVHDPARQAAAIMAAIREEAAKA